MTVPNSKVDVKMESCGLHLWTSICPCELSVNYLNFYFCFVNFKFQNGAHKCYIQGKITFVLG